MKIKPTIGLTGRIKVAVYNDGRMVSESGWTKNLWLDQGLDQLAETPICDCFKFSAKGTGDVDTSEDLTGGANTYSITSGTSTITRAAGTRDFTSDDVGKLVRFDTTPFAEFMITSLVGVTSVTVSPAAGATVTADKIIIYAVDQVGMEEEIGRTGTYSGVEGDSGTVTVDNVRTFTRVFVFPIEDQNTETVAASNTYSQTGTTVTRETGTRDFDTPDVGKTITFSGGDTAFITAAIDDTHVTVTENQSVTAQTITLTGSSGLVTDLSDTNTYSRSGTTVTRTAGSRDFSVNDEGWYIYFDTSGVAAKINTFTDATHVEVDVSGTLAAQTAKLYGFRDYAEIGFSHSEERDENLNIRVLLPSPIRSYISTPVRASDQLIVTYECQLTVEPAALTAADIGSVTTDPGNLMSANKNGDFAIESFATSTVNSFGQTDLSAPDLEPYYTGYAALSDEIGALVQFGNTVRDGEVVAKIADAYVAGSFTRSFTALWGLADGIGTAWRKLILCYNPDSGRSCYAFGWDVNQIKDGTHTFTAVLRKSWWRDLS